MVIPGFLCLRGTNWREMRYAVFVEIHNHVMETRFSQSIIHAAMQYAKFFIPLGFHYTMLIIVLLKFFKPEKAPFISKGAVIAQHVFY